MKCIQEIIDEIENENENGTKVYQQINKQKISERVTAIIGRKETDKEQIKKLKYTDD